MQQPLHALPARVPVGCVIMGGRVWQQHGFTFVWRILCTPDCIFAPRAQTVYMLHNRTQPGQGSETYNGAVDMGPGQNVRANGGIVSCGQCSACMTSRDWTNLPRDWSTLDSNWSQPVGRTHTSRSSACRFGASAMSQDSRRSLAAASRPCTRRFTVVCWPDSTIRGIAPP